MAHSARARPATPTPLQLGSGGLALGKVYERVERARQRRRRRAGRCSPSTMPPKPDADRQRQVRRHVPGRIDRAREAQARRDRPAMTRARTGTTPAPTSRHRVAGPCAAVAPSSRPLGAPRARPIRRRRTPSPSRKPLCSQASRSASVGRLSRGSPSSSSVSFAAAPAGAGAVSAGAGRPLPPGVAGAGDATPPAAPAASEVFTTASTTSAATTAVMQGCAPARRENSRPFTGCMATRAAGSRCSPTAGPRTPRCCGTRARCSGSAPCSDRSRAR